MRCWSQIKECVVCLCCKQKKNPEKHNFCVCVFSWGFARIFGYPVGIIGNNGVLFSESAKKASAVECRKTLCLNIVNFEGHIINENVLYENFIELPRFLSKQNTRVCLFTSASAGHGFYGSLRQQGVRSWVQQPQEGGTLRRQGILALRASHSTGPPCWRGTDILCRWFWDVTSWATL